MRSTADYLERYLTSRQLADSTRILYRDFLKRFFAWAELSELDTFEVTAEDLSAWRDHLRLNNLGESAIHGHTRLLLHYYRWLNANDFLPVNRLAFVPGREKPVTHRDTLSITELRAMWEKAALGRDRVVMGLLAFNSLKNEDLESANVSDLSVVGEHDVLTLRNRRAAHKAPYTVLAPPLVHSLTHYLSGRTSGPLVLSKQSTRADRRVFKAIVARLASQAGIKRTITPASLTFSMREIAISRGFSYVGVVRATGVIDSKKFHDLVSRAPINLTLDPSLRMSRLVTSSGSTTENRLAQAEILLSESDTPAACAAMLVGAALENHLRAFARSERVAVEEERARITTYASALRRQQRISEPDVQMLAVLADIRDTAAHGWFEKVTEAHVRKMLRDARAVVENMPLPADAQN